MAILYPAAIGKPAAHVLFKQGSIAYRQMFYTNFQVRTPVYHHITVFIELCAQWGTLGAPYKHGCLSTQQTSRGPTFLFRSDTLS